MARLCNILFNLLNVTILIFSLVCFSALFNLTDKNGTDCQRAILPPLLVTGVSSFVIAMLGLFGSCCRFRCLLALYILLMFLFVLAQITLTGFLVAVTNQDTHELLLLFSVEPKTLTNLNSRWLETHLWNRKNWSKIRSCLADSRICRSLDFLHLHNPTDLFKMELPSILAGCCLPPASCGFNPVNATFWSAPKTGPSPPQGDCGLWSNEHSKLCFDCQTCKESMVVTTRNEWRLLAKASIALIIVSFLTLVIACATRRNISRDRYRRHYF